MLKTHGGASGRTPLWMIRSGTEPGGELCGAPVPDIT